MTAVLDPKFADPESPWRFLMGRILFEMRPPSPSVRKLDSAQFRRRTRRIIRLQQSPAGHSIVTLLPAPADSAVAMQNDPILCASGKPANTRIQS